MKRTITCFCENTFEVDVNDVIDLDMDSNIFDQILSGTFHIFQCPKCGRTLKPEFKTTFVSKARNLDLLFLPEFDRDSFLRGDLKCNNSRIVIGFLELQEKFKLLKHNLDEKAIELIKAYFLKKAEEGRQNLTVYFGKLKDNKLYFYVDGLKEGETAVTKISTSVYENFCIEVKNKTYDKTFEEMLSPPYISINKYHFEGN